MRHGNKINHLSRKYGHRAALLSNMASSLIISKRIFTTTAKAKELRKYVEPLITKSKEDSTNSRRVVFSYLKNKEAVKELFGAVAERVAERPGGYTRILKTHNRIGDNAEMCMMELVDFNETLTERLSNSTKESAKKTTRRSRRGGKAKSKQTSEVEAKSEEAANTNEQADNSKEADAPAEEKKD
jgi:large subunit ribosomal protein L17